MTQPKRDHCKKGHPLTPDNLYIHTRTGNRRCLICKRAVEAKWNQILKDRRQAKGAYGRQTARGKKKKLPGTTREDSTC